MSSPIFEIPNEVLGEIFAYVPGSLESHFSEINQLTLVCKLWREVAITTPGLWCNIPLHCSRRTSLYLQRSKDALLYVDERSSSRRSIDSIKIALAELRRTKILRLTLSQSDFDHIMHALDHEADAPSAHFLEHLYVARARWSILPNVQLVPPLSPHFFCERLVSLELGNVDMPTKLPVLGSLVRLALDYPPLQQTWSEFADIFRATPVLRALSLKGRSFASTDFTPRNSEKIQLPHLSELRLLEVYPPAHCAAMLDRMEYPSAVLPYISMPAKPGVDFAPLFKHCSYLGRQTLSEIPSTSLTISYCGNHFSLTLSKSSATLFSLSGFPNDDEISGILESSYASLNLAQVRELSFYTQNPWKIPLDRLPYWQLTNLQVVHVSNGALDVVELLEPQTTIVIPNESDLPGIPFPQLKRVVLHRCALTDDHIERLACILLKRNHLGCTLSQIIIFEDAGYNVLSQKSFALLHAQCAVTSRLNLFSDDRREVSVASSNLPAPAGLPSPSPTTESAGVPAPLEVTLLQSPIPENTNVTQSSAEVQSQGPPPQPFHNQDTTANSSAPLHTEATLAQSPGIDNVMLNQSSMDPQPQAPSLHAFHNQDATMGSSISLPSEAMPQQGLQVSAANATLTQPSTDPHPQAFSLQPFNNHRDTSINITQLSTDSQTQATLPRTSNQDPTAESAGVLFPASLQSTSLATTDLSESSMDPRPRTPSHPPCDHQDTTLETSSIPLLSEATTMRRLNSDFTQSSVDPQLELQIPSSHAFSATVESSSALLPYEATPTQGPSPAAAVPTQSSIVPLPQAFPGHQPTTSSSAIDMYLLSLLLSIITALLAQWLLSFFI